MKFDKQLRGYNVLQVDTKIKELEYELEKLRDKEAVIAAAITKATSAAFDMREKAQEDANATRAQAEVDAAQIISDAQVEADRMLSDARAKNSAELLELNNVLESKIASINTVIQKVNEDANSQITDVNNLVNEYVGNTVGFISSSELKLKTFVAEYVRMLQGLLGDNKNVALLMQEQAVTLLEQVQVFKTMDTKVDIGLVEFVAVAEEAGVTLEERYEDESASEDLQIGSGGEVSQESELPAGNLVGFDEPEEAAEVDFGGLEDTPKESEAKLNFDWLDGENKDSESDVNAAMEALKLEQSTSSVLVSDNVDDAVLNAVKGVSDS